jgi:hypothetical protein
MFENQIKAGAQLLDERISGWIDRIYLDNFDIRHTCRCVIGQIYHTESNLECAGTYSVFCFHMETQFITKRRSQKNG